MRSSRKVCRSLSIASGEVDPEALEAAVEEELLAAVALLPVLAAGVRPIWLNAWNMASMSAVRPLPWPLAVGLVPLPSSSPSLSLPVVVAAADAVVDAAEEYRLEVETVNADVPWTVLLPGLPFVPWAA
jgi:hypothetical protein